MKPSTEDCCLLIEKILETWNPPAKDDPQTRCLATYVQTATMQAMAFVMGDDFPHEKLTPLQHKAVNEGLTLYWNWLRESL